jgi:hypothetical protein
MLKSKGHHPPTFGEAAMGENGMLYGVEKVFSHGIGSNQALDYIFTLHKAEWGNKDKLASDIKVHYDATEVQKFHVQNQEFT